MGGNEEERTQGWVKGTTKDRDYTDRWMEQYKSGLSAKDAWVHKWRWSNVGSDSKRGWLLFGQDENEVKDGEKNKGA